MPSQYLWHCFSDMLPVSPGLLSTIWPSGPSAFVLWHSALSFRDWPVLKLQQQEGRSRSQSGDRVRENSKKKNTPLGCPSSYHRMTVLHRHLVLYLPQNQSQHQESTIANSGKTSSVAGGNCPCFVVWASCWFTFSDRTSSLKLAQPCAGLHASIRKCNSLT